MFALNGAAKLLRRITAFGSSVSSDITQRAGEQSKRANDLLATMRFRPVGVARRPQVRGPHATTPWLPPAAQPSTIKNNVHFSSSTDSRASPATVSLISDNADSR